MDDCTLDDPDNCEDEASEDGDESESFTDDDSVTICFDDGCPGASTFNDDNTESGTTETGTDDDGDNTEGSGEPDDSGTDHDENTEHPESSDPDGSGTICRNGRCSPSYDYTDPGNDDELTYGDDGYSGCRNGKCSPSAAEGHNPSDWSSTEPDTTDPDTTEPDNDEDGDNTEWTSDPDDYTDYTDYSCRNGRCSSPDPNWSGTVHDPTDSGTSTETDGAPIAGSPCEEGDEYYTTDSPNYTDGSFDVKGDMVYYWYCQDGSWTYEYIWGGSDYDDDDNSATSVESLDDFSTDEICYELCARKTFGDKNAETGLPDGFPDLEDLMSVDPGAELQACLERCLGPLNFGADDGSATGGSATETGSFTVYDYTDLGSWPSPIETTSTPITTSYWASATTTEEFVTTLTPIATTTSDFATTTVSPSACDEERTHDCPSNSFCVPAENFVTFTCQCEDGYFMSGNMCHKKAPEAESCPEDFKKDLFKMNLDGLNNPKYYLNKGSVMIQVESQVVSRFRIGLD